MNSQKTIYHIATFKTLKFQPTVNKMKILQPKIPLCVPEILNQDIESVTKVLKTGNLVQGEKVKELESFNNKYTKTKHTIAVSSGTATMHLALVALGIKKGDEVIVPAFSYIATANVVELVGATPIFVDIDPQTSTLM